MCASSLPSGAPYAQIQDAVDAAQEGDTILVKTGTYASFVVSARSLTIAGDAGHTVDVVGAVRVRNLGAGQRVVLAQLRATGVGAPSGFGQYGLYASNNTGALRADRCAFVGADADAGHPDGYPGVELINCQDAALAHSSARGGSGRDGWSGISAGRSGDGLHASGSTFAISASSLAGGRGQNGSNCWNSPDGADGGDALQVEGCVVLVCGGVALAGEGGDGVTPTFGCSCLVGSYGGVAGSALASLAGSIVHVQACSEVPARDGNGYGSLCSFQSGSLEPARLGAGFVELSGPARLVEAAVVTRETQDLALRVHGAPGDRVYLLQAGTSEPAAYLGAWEGMLLVPRTRPMLLMLLGTIPASGVLDEGLLAADLGPGVLARTRHLQVLVDDAAGARRLGEAVRSLALDQQF
ncbi:MAG: hypothetical protein IPJ19_13605 [Planctomycetes bacterium]|nr:hypothetical protein [Planctomycetota bacterium]